MQEGRSEYKRVISSCGYNFFYHVQGYAENRWPYHIVVVLGQVDVASFSAISLEIMFLATFFSVAVVGLLLSLSRSCLTVIREGERIECSNEALHSELIWDTYSQALANLLQP